MRAPTRSAKTCVEVSQHVEHVRDLLPREVDADGVAAVRAAQPQVVGAHGPDLGHVQQRMDARGAACLEVAQHAPRPLARDEVLRLEFVARTGREVEPEVRETFVPRPGDPALLGAVDRVVARQGMSLAAGQAAVAGSAGRATRGRSRRAASSRSGPRGPGAQQVKKLTL